MTLGVDGYNDPRTGRHLCQPRNKHRALNGLRFYRAAQLIEVRIELLRLRAEDRSEWVALEQSLALNLISNLAACLHRAVLPMHRGLRARQRSLAGPGRASRAASTKACFRRTADEHWMFKVAEVVSARLHGISKRGSVEQIAQNRRVDGSCRSRHHYMLPIEVLSWLSHQL